MKRILKFIGCLALAFAGAGAYGAITTQAELDAAVKAVADGGTATFELGAGSFTLVDTGVKAGQTITLVGQGMDETTFVIGNGKSDGNQGQADGSLRGAVTFKSLTIRQYNDFQGYNGFIGGETLSLTFEECRFNDGLCYWSRDNKFIKCEFVQNHHWDRYNVQELRGRDGDKYLFEDCVFYSDHGKFINAYKQGGASATVSIVVKNCTFNSTDEADKCALNLKDNHADGCNLILTFVGENKTEGAFPELNEDTKPSKIFATTGKGNATVLFKAKDEDEAVVIYEKGAKVAGAWIDPDGYKAIQAVQVEVKENSGKGITAGIVEEIVANEEVAKVEQAAIAEAIKEEVERKDEAVVKVTLQEVKTEANKTTLQFEVAPYIGAVQVNNDNIKGAVPFRLPLLKEKFVEYAKISHEGDPDRFVLVKKGANDEPYVDVALTHFSTVFASVATEAEMVPDGATLVTADKNGFYVLNDNYYIVGKEGLKNFRDWVNEGNSGEGKTFQLVADVDLGNEEWYPIATREATCETGAKPFKGTFDGCGFTISGLKISTKVAVDYLALFSQINEGSVVKNLTVAGSVGAADVEDAAGVIGCSVGGTIENVTNKVDVVSTKKTGGLLVSARSGTTIRGCANFGTVTLIPQGGNRIAGGITAHVNLLPVTIVDCVNYGEVKVAESVNTGAWIGGIIGNMEQTKIGAVTVTGCRNVGTISSVPADAVIGGIIGHAGGSNTCSVQFTIGDLESSGAFVNAGAQGGIMGSLAGTSTDYTETYPAFVSTGTLTVISGQGFVGARTPNKSPIGLFYIAVLTSGGKDIAFGSVQEAVAAAKEGDMVKLAVASSENFTLKVGVTFDASKAAYSGTISAPEGYFVKEVSTKVYECRPAVAQIDTKIYSSIPEAFTAAVSGDTILILAGTHDLSTTDSINALVDKKVTIKGEGQDKTIINWGSGYKGGMRTDLGQAQFTFEDLALNIDHTVKKDGDGTPGNVYAQCIKHPLGGVTTYRNVTINGLICSEDDVVFDNCTFTGPNENSKDEYLVWQYADKLTLRNCKFTGTGSHAPVKIYAENGNDASLDISNTCFSVVGDEKGVITSSSKNMAPKGYAYDVQIDLATVVPPEGADYLGTESYETGDWPAKGVSVVNGKKDANGKFVSGVVIDSVGTDEQVEAILGNILPYGCAMVPYAGPVTGPVRGEIVKLPDVAEAYDKDGQKVGAYPNLQDAFAAAPSVEKPVDGYTIKLLADVDLAGVEWTPVSFCGTFDGNGKTISNLKVSGTYNTAWAGFFSFFRGNAKDVTFEKADISGNRCGVFAAQVGNSGGASDDNLVMTFENISVTDSKIAGFQKCGGLIGFFPDSNGKAFIRNCTVDGLALNTVVDGGIWQSAGLIGYLQPLGHEDVTITGNAVKDVVFAQDGNSGGYTRSYASGAFIGLIENESGVDRRHTGLGTVVMTGNTVENVTGYAIGPKTNKFIGDFYTTDEVGGGIKDVLKIDLDGEDITLYVAQLAGADKPYKTIAEAMADAKAGDTVNLIYMCDENVALKPDVSFKLNGKEYTGTVTSADDGYMAVYDAETGTWTVKMKIVEVIPAGESEGTKYTTLADALAAVKDGETVKVLKSGNVVTEYEKQIDDAEYSEGKHAEGKRTDTNRLSFGTDAKFTLDLNGKTLTGRINFLKGDMTVSNGTLVAKSQTVNLYGTKLPENAGKPYTTLTIAPTAFIKGAYGVGIFGAEESEAMFPIGFGETVNVYGKIEATDNAIQSSGNIGMDTYKDNIGTSPSVEEITNALHMSVSKMMLAYGPTINVYDGAELSCLPNPQGKSQAIACQGAVICNVYGGKLTGGEAIGVKGGIVSVMGGELNAFGPKVREVLAQNSDWEASGAGISVSTSYNKNSPLSVSVTGGTIKSANNAALQVAHSYSGGNPIAAVQGVSVTVAGGTFIGADGEPAIYVASALPGEEGKYPANFISAKLDEEGKETGYPLCNSPIPAEYIAVGYKEKDNENKTWTVTAMSPEIVVDPTPIADGDKKYVDENGEEKTTPSDAEKTAADKAVKELETTYLDPVLTKVEGTGVADTAVEIQPDGQRTLKSSVVEALNNSSDKPAGVVIKPEDGSNSWSHLVIKLKSTTTKVVTETETVKTSVSEMKVDVKPIVEVKIIDGTTHEKKTVKADLPQDEIPPEGITFPLFVSEAFRGKWALVKHEGDSDYVTEVQEDEKNRPFVMITAKHFSEWLLSVIETSSKTVKRADGRLYDTFEAALADTTTADDETFTLLKDTTEAVKLGAKQTIVTGGYTFGGIDESVLEEGLTEQVNNGDKVFIAPKKVDVPVSDEEGAPVIRVRMRAEGATSSEDNVTKLKTPQSNQRPLWQNMALGVANDFRLIPMIPRSAIGFKTIKICSNLDDATLAAAAKQRDGVAVKFQLLKKVGAGDYVQCGEVQDKPVFNVEADELEPRTFWKIQTIFDEEY